MLLCWRPLILLSLLLSAPAALAQDAHYWHNQYGNRAYMLGGAVIGSSDDVSAVYYNPALLTVAERLNLTVSGNAFFTSTIRLHDALGAEADLVNTKVGAVPSLVAGEIPIGGEEQRLAYSLLFRQDYAFLFDARGTTPLPGLPVDAAVLLDLEEDGQEIWSGLSYAHRLDDRLSMGLSVYASYRSRRSHRQNLAAAAIDSAFAVVLMRDDFDYNHVGLVAKLGAGGRSGPWRYGLTLTTPTLHLWGKGSRSLDRVAGLVTPGGSEGENVSDVQADLRAEYRSPLAVGAGLAYQLARTTFHVSAEWFAAVDPYRIFATDPIFDDTTGERIDVDATTARRSIVNVGVGLEHEFGDRLNGYLGFHTDRSAGSEADLRSQLAVWDVYHASAGVSLDFSDKRIALGVVYAFGDDVIDAAAALPGGAPPGDTSIDPGRSIKVDYRSFLLLVGFGADY